MATSTRRSKSERRRQAKNPLRFTAATADKYVLYQMSVQDADWELQFVTDCYRELRGKEPLHLREDFCGTALTAATFIEGHPERTAEAYDLDPECLQWGRDHHIAELGDASERLKLFQEDVRTPGRKADVRFAHNFSWKVFKQRRELLEYFRAALHGLDDDGILSLDMFGGTDAQEPMEEERWVDDDFMYIWDQDEFWPGNNDCRCFIHFRFPDGSEMKRAFKYEWRLWSMPEVKDLLEEAGFRRVLTYFEEFDDDGDGTGEYKLDERGYPCESWLSYIIALK
ncbi:MAG TPA: class I SAM-dependent methyltransferase [Candidatus Krumholzibacteria bacterium]|jgi:hypothetical protein